MAVAAITPVDITEAGIAAVALGVTTGNTSGGHSFRNDGHQFILASNTNGASTARVLTITTPGDVGGNAIADPTFSIAAGASKWIKVGSPAVYGTTVVMTPDHAELCLSVFTV